MLKYIIYTTLGWLPVVDTHSCSNHSPKLPYSERIYSPAAAIPLWPSHTRPYIWYLIVVANGSSVKYIWFGRTDD